MWHEVCPELVKIDRYLIDGIADSAGKLAIVKALITVADATGADLIAEGIEREVDFVVVRDLGIRFGLGYLLGRPVPVPAHDVPVDLPALLQAKVRVLPQARRPNDNRRVNATHLMIEAPALTPDITNEAVVAVVLEKPDLHALPVVDDAQRVLGLINRRVFAERYARPYARELYGRRSCTAFMHEALLVCEIVQSLDSGSNVSAGEAAGRGEIPTGTIRFRGGAPGGSR